MRKHNAILLPPYADPQPDLAILRVRSDYHRRAHPRPEDIFFLIEVAEATGEVDRTVKLPLYARTGIADVWIGDLAARCVEICRDPGPRGYERMDRFARGESVTLQAFPEIRLAVDEILG